TTARATRGRLRFTLGGRRWRIFQAEVHPRRQLRPVRDEPIAAVALRVNRTRAEESRAEKKDDEGQTTHEHLTLYTRAVRAGTGIGSACGFLAAASTPS